MSDTDPIFEMLRTAKTSAWHFETRDAWALGEGPHRDSFEEFMRTGTVDDSPDATFRSGWLPVVREAVARGIEFRRLRLISEPVTDYIRWEHALTAANVAVGEQVRWLPRRLCMDLAVVPVDFWIVDGSAVRFGLYSGDGEFAGYESRSEPGIAKLVSSTFATAWERGIPHNQYAAV